MTAPRRARIATKNHSNNAPDPLLDFDRLLTELLAIVSQGPDILRDNDGRWPAAVHIIQESLEPTACCAGRVLKCLKAFSFKNHVVLVLKRLRLVVLAAH